MLAFGGEFTSLVRFKDMPMEDANIPPADLNKIMHISLKIGDEFLMASDTLESLGQKLIEGNYAYISITLSKRSPPAVRSRWRWAISPRGPTSAASRTVRRRMDDELHLSDAFVIAAESINPARTTERL